jgi:hypothetical protein
LIVKKRKIKRIKAIPSKGPENRGDESVHLSPLDRNVCPHQFLPFGILLKHSVAEADMENSLQECLGHFPMLCGRLHVDKVRPPRFNKRNSIGFSICLWQGDKDITIVGSNNGIQMEIADCRSAGQELQDILISDSQNTDLSALYSHGSLKIEECLDDASCCTAFVQITYFKDDYMFISITVPHLLMDAYSVEQFLKTWATCCRRQASTSSAGMVVGPTILDAQVLIRAMSSEALDEDQEPEKNLSLLSFIHTVKHWITETLRRLSPRHVQVLQFSAEKLDAIKAEALSGWTAGSSGAQSINNTHSLYGWLLKVCRPPCFAR